MKKFKIFLISSLFIFPRYELLSYASCISESDSFYSGRQDTLDEQLLFNGRVWRNLYHLIKGDQFLFTKEFLTGTVTVNDKLFNNIRIKYDIYNDEIQTITNHGIILQLNKEMVDMFTVKYEDKTYLFQRLEPDSMNILTGYVNILYDGSTSLLVKYKKEILQLAVENRYDLFNQLQRIYVRKENKTYPISSKIDFLNLLSDKKPQIRKYIKNNKLKISKKIPESFIPVIEFYNTLKH